MNALQTAEELCTAFCRILNQWLDVETIAEINRRNSTPEYHDCCATHDFCDPNQAMVEALRALALEFHPALIGLINEAWTLAQQRQFRS